ncbi:hypothetical protein LTR06_008905 [Exophiala xenobiotica]|nr:hypothetical protein LTR06_008905 [Exophiala xenobiotica]
MGSAAQDHPGDFYVEALIIGGGFGGTYALHNFRKNGIQAKLVEAGADFGGVWHWNRYPGARVDSEFPFYQLSIPEVYKTFDFSERFPSDAELHGRTITCKYLVLCTGSSYKKNYPAFPGLKDYAGTLVHSAAYPEAGIDVKGKKVAVIGNGSTGVQIIQELAKQDCSLTAYIRTPIMALPMHQRTITNREQESLKSFYHILLKAGRACKTGFPYGGPAKSFSETNDQEREAMFEELWARGGFSFFLSNFLEFIVDKDVNKCIYNFWAKKTRARVRDPQKRDIVAPSEQEHLFGVKRPSLEQDYYESIDRPNVELVNLKKTPIHKITEHGIMTDKLRAFDIIVLATGYDAMTGSLMDLQIKDKEGKPLREKWKDGVQTYLGMMIDGMPNMFMVYSPQAPTALSNGPPVIEVQVDWAVRAMQKMKSEKIKTIEPRTDFAVKWRKDIQDMNAKTLYPLENSWYMGANIPGKVREQLMYIGGVDAYDAAISSALDSFEGFDLEKY